MNEQKKGQYNNNRLLNASYKKKDDAEELLCQITYFMSHDKPNPTDWIALDKLVKQINKQRCSVPRKVLRSMQNTFDIIQNKYQRG